MTDALGLILLALVVLACAALWSKGALISFCIALAVVAACCYLRGLK